MRTIMPVILAVLLMGTFGCNSLHPSYAALDPEGPRLFDDPTLCAAYRGGVYHGISVRNILTEINRRGLINDDEWGFVRTRTIFVGMGECALLAAWGEPAAVSHFNPDPLITVPDQKQFLFRRGPRNKDTYVYTRDGSITHWTD
ncbi:MAG: hypothetical protein COV76_03445 [Candidatus Omnitrophica bacterium CG11_big_fil_rev_8_21_14_0_20_64_10]|nr:MAG: hypothetical protein COV76_03445 [Candidatus Omnitrophica bacterium CG11_big_fil_rev_8_21_14_0_20_64_10]